MNSLKSMRIFIIAIVILLGLGNVANAQGGSGKTTNNSKTKTTTTSKTKPVKTIPKPLKKNKKIPDPPVADWEITNLTGHWDGTYNEGSSVMRIERVDGVNFYGHLTRGDFQIAFTGFINREKRTVTITETEVLRKPNDGRGWVLGINTGTVDYGGFEMRGTGKNANTIYTWSYGQNLLID